MMFAVRVWDLPTRVFHWALVACVVGLLITAQVGGAAMQWHFRLGYSVLCLLLFRFIWGVIGGHWSRFGSFVHGPRTLLDYLRGRLTQRMDIGHNPLGALSVLAMLGFLLMQVSSGLMSDDEISAAGPLTRWVSSEWVGWATFYHRNIGKWVLLTLVALHLCAIAFYGVAKHENLVRPMLTGNKMLTEAYPSSNDGARQRLLAVGLVMALATSLSLALSWLES